jgi:hypothetical protein
LQDCLNKTNWQNCVVWTSGTIRSSCERHAVPSYLFHCRNCQKPFTKQLSLQEYEESNVVCPLCESDEVDPVDQQLPLFYAVTSKKSA